MTYRTLLLAAAGAASFAFAANAQETPPTEATNPPAAESAATPSSATAGAAFQAGATVKDATGADVGVIQGVSEGDTGPVVVLQIDGALYGVPASNLSSSGGDTVSSHTKAEIKASAKPQK